MCLGQGQGPGLLGCRADPEDKRPGGQLAGLVEGSGLRGMGSGSTFPLVQGTIKLGQHGSGVRGLAGAGWEQGPQVWAQTEGSVRLDTQRKPEWGPKT